MRWRPALMGMVMVAVPGLLGASLLRSDPVVATWPESPADRPSLLVKPPPRWDKPARESLALLRRVTATEARRSGSALASCEARAALVSEARRSRHFRRCATTPLARVDGFATANSRMLSNLAGSAGPTVACRGRVLTLSGMTSALGFSARSTLRGGLDAPWGELLAASRAIRAVAREASKLARAPGWSATCRIRPPAAPAPPDVA